jgi:5-dehydro-2-deoxygluconokinase
VFDCDWRPSLWANPGAYPPVAAEAAAAADLVVGGEDEVEAAGLQDARPLVLKRGGRGSTVFEADGTTTDVPVTPVEVVNGLGAGDAFGGALCHGLLAGWELERMMRFCNAAGALVASRLSCADAMPTEDEVEATLAAGHA